MRKDVANDDLEKFEVVENIRCIWVRGIKVWRDYRIGWYITGQRNHAAMDSRDLLSINV